jgi:hypothetical protein
LVEPKTVAAPLLTDADAAFLFGAHASKHGHQAGRR